MICKILKKTASVGSWVIIGILTISLISLLVTGFSTGKPNVFGIRPMIVVSESMVPTLEVGSIIIGKPATAEEIEIGDIVAYRLPSKTVENIAVTVVHRVLDKTEEGFVFKGDNNDMLDELVYPEQILYKIIYPVQEGEQYD